MKRLLSLLGVVIATAAAPASAHHSFAAFDRTRQVTFTGVVREFQWSNPHTWIQLNVADASGKVVEWSIEGGSPNLLGRQGWKRNTLKSGDPIEVTINPLRDGQPGGSFVRALLPDGRKLGRSQIPPAPTAAQ